MVSFCGNEVEPGEWSLDDAPTVDVDKPSI